MTTASKPATAAPALGQLQMIALVVGVIGVAILLLGFFVMGPQPFFQAYLYGYLFSMSLPLGCLGFLLLQHIVGGQWGLVTRRMLEAGALTLPIMALLFLPIVAAVTVFGPQGILYEWTDVQGHVLPDPIVAHKLPYLNVPFFLGRAVIYFVIWAGLALLLRNWSLEQDRTGNPSLVARMRMLSGVGAALFILTASFALFDWGMSLDSHWFSTIYGVMFIVGDGLLTLAFLIIMIRLLYAKEPMAGFVSTKQVHDLGKLMFAFTVLWAYVNFAQYVIIWSGNVAEFTPWYQRRTVGGWEWFIPFLIVFNFFVPFFILLSRRRKRTITAVVYVAAWMVLMRLIDMGWVILPEFRESFFNPYLWMDLAAPIGLVGIWIALFVAVLRRAPLLPMNDPGIVFLKHGGGHH